MKFEFVTDKDPFFYEPKLGTLTGREYDKFTEYNQDSTLKDLVELSITQTKQYFEPTRVNKLDRDRLKER